jgi:hypothetical protein
MSEVVGSDVRRNCGDRIGEPNTIQAGSEASYCLTIGEGSLGTTCAIERRGYGKTEAGDDEREVDEPQMVSEFREVNQEGIIIRLH